MKNHLALLRRDDRGASLIEFALVAPFLATLTIGMVDLSRAYSMKVQLTQAAQRAIEHAMQGTKTTDLYDTLQAEAATTADVPTSAVTVTYWTECNGVSQMTSRASMTTDFEKVCSTGVAMARYVTVDVQKTYTPIFGTRFAGSNSDGSYTLHGKAGIRVQ